MTNTIARLERRRHGVAEVEQRMTMDAGGDTGSLEELRRLTFAIAYRMTGSVSDAEDLGQEAFLRLEETRRHGETIDSPRAWLSTVTTRLAIDYMRSARVQREQYIGPWLPEPLLTEEGPGPAEHAEAADTISQAFLILLERLSPVERAVFLLREVFEFDYAQIAESVGRSEENCRQIATRARKHLEAHRTRFDADDVERERLLDRFIEASEEGDVDGLRDVLAAGATVYSDGGGKITAARRPFGGVDRIARFMINISRARRETAGATLVSSMVNGRPARLVIDPDGQVESVLTVEVDKGLIQTIRVVRNPDKLRHL